MYAAYKLIVKAIDGAISRTLGGERDDQRIGGIKPGSLHVLLHCLADQRPLEVLEDFECGTMKERLEKKFSEIGIKVEGLMVEIDNIEEVKYVRSLHVGIIHINSLQFNVILIIFYSLIILYSLSSKNNTAESDKTSEEAKTSEVKLVQMCVLVHRSDGFEWPAYFFLNSLSKKMSSLLSIWSCLMV